MIFIFNFHLHFSLYIQIPSSTNQFTNFNVTSQGIKVIDHNRMYKNRGTSFVKEKIIKSQILTSWKPKYIFLKCLPIFLIIYVIAVYNLRQGHWLTSHLITVLIHNFLIPIKLCLTFLPEVFAPPHSKLIHREFCFSWSQKHITVIVQYCQR